jgi:hypothetical protein
MLSHNHFVAKADPIPSPCSTLVISDGIFSDGAKGVLVHEW